METNKQLSPLKAHKDFFSKDTVKSKFQELLGAKAPQFITGVMQVVNNNNLLQKASPESIYQAAAVAAILDLPINQNLGFAWIVPYGQQAQFQMGWRGYVQLAQRTGQYHKITVGVVFENQFKSFNYLTEELDADMNIVGSGNISGYFAYFKTINGFEKLVFWTKQQVENHAKKFSKSFNSGPWKDHFDEMAKKTVLKQALSKWGILSIDIQRAVTADQAVITGTDEEITAEYVDGVESVDQAPESIEQKAEQVAAKKEALKNGKDEQMKIEDQMP